MRHAGVGYHFSLCLSAECLDGREVHAVMGRPLSQAPCGNHSYRHHPHHVLGLISMPQCQEYNTDQDLEPPTDDLLDFISSQEHSDDQLD